MNLEPDCILHLSINVLVRFEHNLEGGVLFLYNADSKCLWKGNSATRDLIALISRKLTLEEIYAELFSKYKGYKPSEVIESFNSIIFNLISEKYLTVISGKKVKDKDGPKATKIEN